MHQPTPPSTYTGRTTTEPGAYFYQHVRCLQQEEPLPRLADGVLGVALLGYAVEEGVRRNLGRLGAAAGPAAIRSRLGREPWHLPESVSVVDLGDVHCEAGNLQAAQDSLSARVAEAHQKGYVSLVLGGGHDVASAHYRGLRPPNSTPLAAHRLGVVNFDAHLDLRAIEHEQLTSGTPFSAIAHDCHRANRPFDYLCFGAQQQANTAGLFARAAALGAEVILLDELPNGKQRLAQFSERVDQLYLTVDLDGFPGYVSPGVSAPGVEGLDVRTVTAAIRALVATGKVVAFDLAECNPQFDLDGRTARLGARLAMTFLLAMAAQHT